MPLPWPSPRNQCRKQDRGRPDWKRHEVVRTRGLTAKPPRYAIPPAATAPTAATAATAARSKNPVHKRHPRVSGPQAGIFEARCSAVRLSAYEHEPLPHPALHSERIASWRGIFNRDSAPSMPEWMTDPTISMQATFLELHQGGVVDVVSFGRIGTTRRLPPPAPRFEGSNWAGHGRCHCRGVAGNMERRPGLLCRRNSQIGMTGSAPNAMA